MKKLPLFVASLLAAPLSFAEPAADAPAKTDIPALIKQLGDDNPKTRDQASRKLRALGADALPALEKARESQDPEVVNRAEVVTQQIDNDLHPKPAAGTRRDSIFSDRRIAGRPGHIQVQITSTMTVGNGHSLSVSRSKNGNVSETTVKEDGKKTTIREDDKGITISITEKKDGKDSTQTTKAKNKEELKKDHPDLFDMYDKYTRDDLEINQGGVIIHSKVGQPDPREIEKSIREAQQRAQQEIERARKELEEQVRQKPKTDDKPAK